FCQSTEQGLDSKIPESEELNWGVDLKYTQGVLDIEKVEKVTDLSIPRGMNKGDEGHDSTASAQRSAGALSSHRECFLADPAPDFHCFVSIQQKKTPFPRKNTVQRLMPSGSHWSNAPPACRMGLRGTGSDFMKRESSQLHGTYVNRSKKQLMDTMFIVGGWSQCAPSCAVERFYPFYNEWRTMAPMLKRCGDVGVCSSSGMIFAVGGRDDITCVSSVERYDANTDTWSSEVASLSSPRSGVCLLEMDGFIYALGGFDGAACTNIVERYDPMLDTWTKLAPMRQNRSGAAAAVLDGFLYVIGGTDGDTALNSVERFNPWEGSWHTCPPMRTAREHPGCVVYLERIYVAGGRDELQLELRTAEKFDPESQQWTPVKSMRHKRFQTLWLVVTRPFNAMEDGAVRSTFSSEVLHGLLALASEEHVRIGSP
ncbi:hypothetical protein DNTS_011369, partial [Danionella cerebrum]